MRTNFIISTGSTPSKQITVNLSRFCCQKATPPAPLPGIVRESSLKVLGVTLTQNLSASDHVRGVISNCSQTLYALRVLWNSGMWNGFITETD